MESQWTSINKPEVVAKFDIELTVANAQTLNRDRAGGAGDLRELLANVTLNLFRMDFNCWYEGQDGTHDLNKKEKPKPPKEEKPKEV